MNKKMNGKKLVAVATILISSIASVAQAGFSEWNVLAKNTIQASLDTSKIQCENGNPPNGHNFPTWAIAWVPREALVQKTSDGRELTGWYGSNVKSYRMRIPNVYSCLDLPADLLAGQKIAIVGKQTIAEIHQLFATGVCEKVLRESIEIEGGKYKLFGDQEMRVHPIDVKNCASVKKD